MSAESPTPLHRPARIPYQPALNGLRGIALLVMLAYHGNVSWLGGGYLSVSTFFTLSGFLITALLVIEQESNPSGRIDLGAFWVGRLRRLLPAALAGVALAALYAAVAGTPGQLVRLPWDTAAALLYFANFRFMTSGHSYWEMFSRPSPLQHYWSLSIEEQFYLLYPVLLMGIALVTRRSRTQLRMVLAILAVASTAVMMALSWSGAAPARLYYGTDTRAAEFLVGALLAAVLVRDAQIRPWMGRGSGMATLVASVYCVALLFLVGGDSAFLYRGGFLLYAIATAVLINAALCPGIVRAVLSWRPLVWIGTVSYGAYVFHWPIDLAIDEHRTGLSGVTLLAVQITATLVLARLSYVVLEQPIRSRRWPTGASAVLAPLGAAAVVAAVVALVTANTSARVDHDRGGPWAPTPMPDVSSPARANAPRVLVLGDSVAWTLGQGFTAWARRSGDAIVAWNLAVYGCGLARGHEQSPVAQLQIDRKCDDWPGWWEAEVDRFRPDVVIILSGLWDLVERRLPGSDRINAPGEQIFDDWLLSEYQLAVDIASSRGARVVWLTAPCLGPDAARSPVGQTAAIEPHNIDHLNRVVLPQLAQSRPRQVVLFDLFDRICPGGRFVSQLPWAKDLRPDDIHIGRRATQHLAGDIISATWPALGLKLPGTMPIGGSLAFGQSNAGLEASGRP